MILTGSRGAFRFLVSFSNTEVLLQNAKIVGQFDAEGLQITEGMLGGAVFEDLEEVVLNDPEIGPQFADVMLAFEKQLDTDLDDDGDFDAMSTFFQSEAVPAMIDRESPCAE